MQETVHFSSLLFFWRKCWKPHWRHWISFFVQQFLIILWMYENQSHGIFFLLNMSLKTKNSALFLRVPGEMKKVLQSFLSRVTSRISFVMLTSLPATGGTRRKSRTLQDGGTYWGVTICLNNTAHVFKLCTAEKWRNINEGHCVCPKNNRNIVTAANTEWLWHKEAINVL